jgi:hypothetical protein
MGLAISVCLLLAAACGAGDKKSESNQPDGSTPSGDGDHSGRDAGDGNGSHHGDGGSGGDGDGDGTVNGDGDTSHPDQDAGHPSPADSFFISVAGGTKIVRSDDGSEWTVVNDTFDGTAGWNAYDSEDLFRAACAGRLPSGDPLVLAVGGGAASSDAGHAVGQFPARIARSTDGKTWTHTVSLDGAAEAVLLNLNWLGGCAFGNGIVVASGAFYSLTSTDGKNWQKHSPKIANNVEFYARNMTFGAGLFVASGDHGIYVSSNGVDWELVSTQKANRIYFHGGVFIAAQEDQTGYQRSTDGRHWESLTAPATINRVAHDGKRFIASSGAAMGPLLTSDDGKSFTAHPNKGFEGLTGIAFGKGTYVSLNGTNGALYFRGDVTADGPITWQHASVPGDAEGTHSLSIFFAAF